MFFLFAGGVIATGCRQTGKPHLNASNALPSNRRDLPTRRTVLQMLTPIHEIPVPALKNNRGFNTSTSSFQNSTFSNIAVFNHSEQNSITAKS
jgi:hypothetical protein